MTRSADIPARTSALPPRFALAIAIVAATIASCAGGSGAERRASRQAAFVAISAGEHHVCGLRRSGAGSCFLVEPSAESATSPSAVPLPVGDAFDGVVALAAGRDRSCAIRADRSLVCVAHDSSIPLVTPSSVEDAVAIGMGSMHLAVVRPDRVVEVYDLRDGQLAIQTRRTADGHLELSEEAVGADLGSRFGCAATASGHAFCWGSNWGGECGNGGDGLESQPVMVVPAIASDSPDVARAFEGCDPSCEGALEGVVRLDVRGRTACALLDREGLVCWGESSGGSFLPAETTPAFSRRPVSVAGTDGADDLCVGRAHVCTLRDDSVSCRGEPAFATPARPEVESLRGAAAIACTADSVCGLFDDGTARCEGGAGTLRLR